MTKKMMGLLAGIICYGLSVSVAQAALIGFNLNITATESNSNFGAGIVSGEAFTGMMYFDTTDIMEGEVTRSVNPGIDTLTMAGVSFDSVLNSVYWFFFFSGGVPVCIEGGTTPGCVPGEAPQDTILSGTTPGLDFSDNLTGVAYDAGGDTIAFNYNFSTVPEPTSLLLMGLGLAGVGFARCRKLN